MVKAISHLLFAASLVNFFPVDGLLLEWQAGVDTPSDYLASDLLQSAGVLPKAADRLASPPKKIIPESFGVVVTAQSAIVIDSATGASLYTKNPNAVRAIGSISKLMAALVFLDTQPNLQDLATVRPEDFAGTGRVFLYYNDEVSLEDILGTSLVGSDNTATLALVRLSGLSREEFVSRMNTKASELGLINTHFSDPSGLSAENVSTAGELAVLLTEAKGHEEISQFMQTATLQVVQASGRSVSIPSTNQLLNSVLDTGSYSITAGKTGYIPQAGYCLAVGVNHDGHEILVVVLGAEDNDARFEDATDLAGWAFKTFEWPAL